MKKEALIISIIVTMWIPILFSYIEPSDLLTYGTKLLYSIFFASVGTYAIYKYTKVKLTVPIPGRYWIKEGKHYADGLMWTNLRNVKFFFFKKEITFWYRLSEEAIQDDAYQKNKIFGITSVLYRKNSVREVFASRIKRKLFDAYEYSYKDGFNQQLIKEIDRKPKQWYKSTLKAHKMIWFGLYHFPYHGGKIPSKKKYSIDIRFDEPS